MLSGFIDTLSRRPRLTFALTVIYFLATSLPHDIGQQATLRAYDRFTKQAVDRAFIAAAILAFAVGAWFCISRLQTARRSGTLPRIITLAVLWLVLFLGSFRWLFYANAEIVHFPQFAILALLLFALTGSHARTLFAVVVLAIVDEAYQYWFIYNPRFPSLLDFNDVVFDTLGGAAACLILHLDGATSRNRASPVRWRRSPMVWIPVAVLLIAVVLHQAGVLGLYPDLEGEVRPIQLSRQRMEPYWRELPGGRIHHVLRPWEALPILAVVIGAFGSMDRPKWDHRRAELL